MYFKFIIKTLHYIDILFSGFSSPPTNSTGKSQCLLKNKFRKTNPAACIPSGDSVVLNVETPFSNETNDCDLDSYTAYSFLEQTSDLAIFSLFRYLFIENARHLHSEYIHICLVFEKSY